MASKKKQLVRQLFRDAVFKRAGFKCQGYNCPVENVTVEELDAHHITDRTQMPNGGYVKENGISLCPTCHKMAEVFHSTGNALDGWHPNDLYVIIGSNYEIAFSVAARM